MHKVRLIYDVDGWAFHRRSLALVKYAPADLEITIAALTNGGKVDYDRALGDTAPDVVFQFYHGGTQTLRAEIERRGWRCKVGVGWNDGWPGKLKQFDTAYRDVDFVIINNRDFWIRAGRPAKSRQFSNGVDLDIFRVVTPLARRRARVLWVGSERFRTLKGYDDFIVPLKAELTRKGIDCETLLVDSFGDKRLSCEEMVSWYNLGTVLICASESEGTPNPGLEAAACGCTVVSTPVGNMPELLRDGENGFLVERDLQAMLDAAETACRSYLKLARRMQQDIQAWSWSSRSLQYYDFFRELCRD